MSYVSLLLLIPVGGIILLFDDVLPFEILDALRIAVELLELLIFLKEVLLLLLLY